MAQISIVKYSDVLKARRFDAEYFKKEYLEIEERLDYLKHFYFSNCCENSGKSQTQKRKQRFA